MWGRRYCTLHCTLHCTALHCTALHCTAAQVVYDSVKDGLISSGRLRDSVPCHLASALVAGVRGLRGEIGGIGQLREKGRNVREKNYFR
jgi:hypothetical protein